MKQRERKKVRKKVECEGESIRIDVSAEAVVSP